MTVVTRAGLDARHRERQGAIADTVAGRLEVLLRTMPDLSQAELERYVADAYPTVAGGQAAAADTAAGYMGTLAGPAPRRAARPPDVGRALARTGVLVEPDSRSLVAPVLRARTLVAGGDGQAVALEQAASYAGALSSNDLQAAMRVGLAEGADAGDMEVHGWRKGLSPSACTWCQSIANRLYDDPESIPFHDADRCGVEPELEEQAPYVFDGSDIPF